MKDIERAAKQLQALCRVRVVEDREDLFNLPHTVLGAVVPLSEPDGPILGTPYIRYRGKWIATIPERLMGYERNTWRRVLLGILYGQPFLGVA